MKRIVFLVAALVLAAASPAAAKVHSHDVDQSASSARAFWTADRMRSAVPVERAKGGNAGKGKPGATSSWATIKVTWPSTSSALDAHGKVFFSDGPYTYVCSGTLVSSSSGSVVWTAGHCVNEGPGDYFNNWIFIPAYNRNGVREPYGRWAAESLHTTTNWRTKTNAYGEDLGAARVEVKGASLQASLGTARTMTTGVQATGTQVDSYGYPAAGKYSGSDLYMCDSYISRRDTSTTPATYGIPCGMTGGSSGGGWILPGTSSLVSVNSYGYQGLKDTMFGPVQGTSATNLLSAANTAG